MTGQVNTQALAGVIEVEDTAQFRIRFASGAVGLFYATTGYGVDDEVEVEVVMEKGVFWLRGDQLYRRPHGQELEMICRNENLIPKGKDYWGTGHLKQIADYYDAIRQQPADPYRRQGGLCCAFYRAGALSVRRGRRR